MPETRQCDYCGSAVTRPPSRFNGEHAFCKGSDCRSNFMESKVSLDCDNCGDTFDRVPSRVNEHENYCEEACRKEGQSNLVSVPCDNCGEMFERTASQISGLNFHSTKCRDEFQRGESNPNWRGGHDNWSTLPEAREWRESVFSRDSYECQDCGRSECRLNAHHILRRSEHPEKALGVDVGITTCLMCHARRHFESGEMGAYRLIKGNINRLDNV